MPQPRTETAFLWWKWKLLESVLGLPSCLAGCVSSWLFLDLLIVSYGPQVTASRTWVCGVCGRGSC